MPNKFLDKKEKMLKKKIKNMKPGDAGMMKRTKKAAGGMLKEPPAGKKGKGLRKLPKEVRNKMGYMKKGGMVKKGKK